MGEVTSQELIWLDSDTLITTAMKKENGEPTIERGVTHYKGDTLRFVVEKAVGSQPFFVFVKGAMKRVPDAKAVDLSKVGASFGHSIPEMEKLTRMADRYEMSGSYRMGHGQEMKEFTGQYHVKPLFGGLILEGVESDSDGYEA